MASQNPMASAKEFEYRLGEIVTKVLDEAGMAIKAQVKQNLMNSQEMNNQYGGIGRAYRSVDYTTSAFRSPEYQTGGRQAEGADYPNDHIPNTKGPYEMNVGVGVPYAYYIEHGAGPHTGSSSGSVDKDGGTFIEKMEAYAFNIGLRIDENEDDKARFEGMIKSIRNKGTTARPFWNAHVFEMENIVRKLLSRRVKALRLPTKEVKIEVDLTVRR